MKSGISKRRKHGEICRKASQKMRVRWQVWIFLFAAAAFLLAVAMSYNWTSTDQYRSVKMRFESSEATESNP